MTDRRASWLSGTLLRPYFSQFYPIGEPRWGMFRMTFAHVSGSAQLVRVDCGVLNSIHEGPPLWAVPLRKMLLVSCCIAVASS
jgi:hypothetical protein